MDKCIITPSNKEMLYIHFKTNASLKRNSIKLTKGSRSRFPSQLNLKTSKPESAITEHHIPKSTCNDSKVNLNQIAFDTSPPKVMKKNK